MVRRFVPFLVLATFVAYLAAPVLTLRSKAAGGFDIAGLRSLPVSVNGRVQPFDSAARIALQRIRGSATVPTDRAGAGAPPRLAADEWLLEVLARPDTADTRKVFPIAERQLISTLKLTPAAGTSCFAYRDVASKVVEIGKQTERISKMKETDRAPWERELLVLRAKLVAYERLKNSVQPNSLLQLEAKGSPVTFDFAAELSKYHTDLAEAVRVAGRRKNGGREQLDLPTEQRLRAFSGRFEGVSRIGLVAMVPPFNPNDPKDRWATTGAAIVNSARGGRLAQPVGYIATLTTAFAHGRPEAFNDAVAKYRRWLNANGLAQAVRVSGYEAVYNVFLPFVRAIAIYAVGLVLLVFARAARSTTARRAALLLIPLGFAAHTLGVAFTYQLAGRPTTLTFAGWATALIALGLGWWRRGAGMAACAATGVIALTASYAMAPGGVAVLTRNIPSRDWLAAIAITVIAVGSAGLLARAAAGPRKESAIGRPRGQTAIVH